jgi:diguanylate cyclase (GGDEF)-like protein
LAGDAYRLVHTDDFRAEVDALHARLTADTLTGVSTREHLLAVLRLRLHMANREGGSVSIVVADLDHFKRVNDQFGHAGGDAVLREISSRMKSVLREADVIGRLGGEEFVIVLDGAALQGAAALAERVRQRVSSRPCPFGLQEISVTVSQGVAESAPNETMESLLGRADACLYSAKRSGRDRVMTEAAAAPQDPATLAAPASEPPAQKVPAN